MSFEFNVKVTFNNKYLNFVILFNNINKQQDATTFSFINLFKSAQTVSGDKIAHPQEHFFNCIYSFWYNAPPLLTIGATDCQQGRCIVPKAVYTVKKVLLRMGGFVARNSLV